MNSKGIFLVAFYTMRPKTKHASIVKGWTKDADLVSYDESINIVFKLKNRDITTAKVILDLVERKIVRNSWNSDNSFEELFEYYRAGYPQYLDPVAKQLSYDQVNTVTEDKDGSETTEETVQTQEETTS